MTGTGKPQPISGRAQTPTAEGRRRGGEEDSQISFIRCLLELSVVGLNEFIQRSYRHKLVSSLCQNAWSQSKDMNEKQTQIDQQSQPFVASYHSLHKCCQPLASLKRIKRLNFLTSSIVLQGTGLLEKLLTMLDPLSITRLIQSELVDKNVLKDSLSSKIWAPIRL